MVKQTKKERFEKICEQIRSIKIQGAENVALKGLEAYYLLRTPEAKRKLLSLRPTEPMLKNLLEIADKHSFREIKISLRKRKEKINLVVERLLVGKKRVFTFCHSSSVVNALIYSFKKGRRFEVYNAETRPLYQGRKTSSELYKHGIKVTFFVDSLIATIFAGKIIEKPDLVLVGADAFLEDGFVNKVGSLGIALLANYYKIPFYVVGDSLKFSSERIVIEERASEEVWETNSKITILNPAFDFVEWRFVKGVISEIGLLKPQRFVKVIKKVKDANFGSK